MKHPISAISLIVGSLIAAPHIKAAESWFEVEVILFERHGEKSNEKFKDLIKQIDTSKAIALETDALYGTLKDCPSLSQFERFGLQQVDLAKSSVAPLQTTEFPGQPITTELSTNTGPLNNVEKSITQCILPDDTRLIEAYSIKRQRLDNIIDTTPELVSPAEQSLAQILTSSNEDHVGTIDDEILAPPTYDASVFVPYPTSFTFNAIDYQGVVKPAPISKVPVTIKHEFVLEVAEKSTQASDSIEQTLEHDPNGPYLLDDAHLQMTKLAKKLRWQKSTTPLLHLGWRQPMLARHLAKPLHLFAGNDYSNEFDLQGNDKRTPTIIDELSVEAQDVDVSSVITQEIPVAPSTDISDILSEIPAHDPLLPIWKLDGLLNIYLNHFLFIETDFDLRKVEQVKVEQTVTQALLTEDGSIQESILIENSQDDSSITPQYVAKLTSHPMKQHRRVRSKEIHYFDHPNMGIIIQIRRFKVPEAPTMVQ